MDLAGFDAALKENYPISKIETQLNEAKVLYAQVKKHSKTIQTDGRRAIIPIQTGWSQGVSARGENDNLPEAQRSSINDSVVTLRYNYARVQVSGVSMDLSRTNVGSFARAWDFEMDSALTAFMRDINRQMISGDGVGKITKVIAGTVYTAATTIGVDSVVDLFENMEIDIFDNPTSTGGTLITGGGKNKIVSVDVFNKTITLVNPITKTTATPSVTYILRYAAKGLEMMGLAGIIDNGTTVNNLQGIDRQLVTRWQANVFANGGTLRAITEAVLQPGYTAVEKTGKIADLIISSYELRDGLATTLTPFKRFTNTIDLKGGFKGLDYNGSAFVVDEQSPNDRVRFARTDQLEIVQSRSPHWDDMGGTIVSKVSGKDAVEAFLKWYSEFGTNRSNAHSDVRDLKPV
jgi:hypothetical protein